MEIHEFSILLLLILLFPSSSTSLPNIPLHVEESLPLPISQLLSNMLNSIPFDQHPFYWGIAMTELTAVESDFKGQFQAFQDRHSIDPSILPRAQGSGIPPIDDPNWKFTFQVYHNFLLTLLDTKLGFPWIYLSSRIGY